MKLLASRNHKAALRGNQFGGLEMVDVTPFLLFDGNCAEAMEFYKSCFGGDLSITRVADVNWPQARPPALQNKVAYAHLKSGGIEFSATDWQHQTRKPQQGNTVAIYVTGGAYGELREIFDKLSVGGDRDLLDDLQEQPFGVYGHCADKYGVHWFFRGEPQTNVV